MRAGIEKTRETIDTINERFDPAGLRATESFGLSIRAV
jgi:hypothetical protein